MEKRYGKDGKKRWQRWKKIVKRGGKDGKNIW